MIIDGRKIRKDIALELEQAIKDQDLDLSLAVVFKKGDKVSEQFVSVKQRFGQKIGVKVETFTYEDNWTEADLEELVIDLINQGFNGILIQLPLPNHFNTKKILDLVPSNLDPDMLSESSKELILSSQFKFMPPVVGAIREMIQRYEIDLTEKKIVVLGAGALVGQPVIKWLQYLGLDPIVLTEKEKDNLGEFLSDADIVISGVGKSRLIKADMVKEGVILFDAGTSEVAGEVVGDIDASACKKASFYTPVPGGIGPVAVSVLFKNLVCMQQDVQ